MRAKEIDKILRYCLDNQFVLSNTYIYNWECDYFGVSKSGYAYEIEIKVSRSDFFADFKKDKKHKILQLAKQGKSHITTRDYLEYSYERKDWQGNLQTIKSHTRALELPDNEIEQNQKIISSHVNFKKVFAPNRFYYACPDGLIKKEEVPKYAGLIYVKEGLIKKVKEAPFLHKNLNDLNAILLHKFHQKTIGLAMEINWLKQENEKLRAIDGDIVGLSTTQNTQELMQFSF